MPIKRDVLYHRRYREFLKNKKCLCHKTHPKECLYATEAHHIRSHEGLSKYPYDIRNGISCLVPLCAYHHRGEYHQKGKHSFRRKYGLDLENIAQELYIEYLSKCDT